ncbi:cGMP-dependent protein kinase [Plakobranchus ocellatus]|uniref:cGMP-dependent protein kinase n=1 Tax=Plakobranchus ocellatus TaxID=259542 RepID=A0AAV4ACW8_9GAST|nr:cGMP-dependent protein kinase [Plakobranchus ocellatus]
MGSLQEMERLLRLKDEKIIELQKLLEEKEESIMQLRSKLDKFQSVLPQTQNTFIQGGPRKQRAQGISAEPQALRNLSDFSKTNNRRYSKSNR